jgi:DNA-binding FrmR family transcriptional regulator
MIIAGGYPMEEKECCCCGRQKATPRSEKVIKSLQNRIKRLIGQLNGISKMIDENRYCGDILIQIMACQNALKSIGNNIFTEHFKTCVVEKIKNDDEEVIDETLELIKTFR